jgi:hypothetical protein
MTSEREREMKEEKSKVIVSVCSWFVHVVVVVVEDDDRYYLP